MLDKLEQAARILVLATVGGFFYHATSLIVTIEKFCEVLGR